MWIICRGQCGRKRQCQPIRSNITKEYLCEECMRKYATRERVSAKLEWSVFLSSQKRVSLCINKRRA